MIFVSLFVWMGLAQDAAVTTETYVWVVLTSGPSQDLPQDKMKQAMAGHFENMGRMAESGQLLLAGPLGPPRARPENRGIFIFNTGDIEQARSWAASDPAVKAGIFALSFHRFETADPVSEIPSLERDAQAARESDPDVPDAWQGRPFVLLTSTDIPRQPLSDAHILFQGRIEGFAANGEAVWVMAVDATTVEQARTMFAQRDWTAHGWYSGKALEGLLRVDP